MIEDHLVLVMKWDLFEWDKGKWLVNTANTIRTLMNQKQYLIGSNIIN